MAIESRSEDWYLCQLKFVSIQECHFRYVWKLDSGQNESYLVKRWVIDRSALFCDTHDNSWQIVELNSWNWIKETWLTKCGTRTAFAIPCNVLTFPNSEPTRKKKKTFHGNSEIHFRNFMELLWLAALIFLKGTVEEEYKDTR